MIAVAKANASAIASATAVAIALDTAIFAIAVGALVVFMMCVIAMLSDTECAVDDNNNLKHDNDNHYSKLCQIQT